MPTHKTAHLQTTQTDTRPKFAKELFSCRPTQKILSLLFIYKGKKLCQKIKVKPLTASF